MATKAKSTSKKAKGSYGIKKWEEKLWDGRDYKEVSGAKLTHAMIVFPFEGDFEGEANVQMVMSYTDDKNATFVGLQQMTGKLGDKTGSFVMEVTGVFENGAANSKWKIIPGSGTGDLNGIKGKGESIATHGDKQPFTLTYSFE